MESSKRHSNALKVLGPELSGKVGSSKVLCVGAGGIGCELLKNLVMVGFGNIEIVSSFSYSPDVQWSRASWVTSVVIGRLGHHRRQQPQPTVLVPKATRQETQSDREDLSETLLPPAQCNTSDCSIWVQVAKETASKFNPNVSINALHANIKDPKFDLAYFKSFDVVLNALDNLGEQAKRSVPWRDQRCSMIGWPGVVD